MIDRDTASRLGITSQVIDDTLYDAFGQRQVSITYTLSEPVPRGHGGGAEFLAAARRRCATFMSAPPTGAMVPLSAFARFERTATSLAVNHQGQFPAVTISFNLAPGKSLGEAVKAVEAATRQMGLPASIRGSFQGTAQAFQASLANQPLLILAALVTVYIVLGMLYESYIHPITILSTLPSAGVGALLALLIFRTDLSLIAIIGIILLIGIVKKNGIMMVDFALEAERKEGKSPEEAIYQACLLRFQADHDDHHGGPARRPAPGAGHGGGLGASPSPGHRHRRRTDLQPDAHPLYDTGDVSLSRPVQAAA